jgi:hypothetical protein
MAEEIAECDNPPLPTADGLARWGVLDEKQRRAVRERAFTQVVLPLVRGFD